MSVGRSPVTIIIVRPMHMSTAAMVPTMTGVLNFVLSDRDVPCPARPARVFLVRYQHVSYGRTLSWGWLAVAAGMPALQTDSYEFISKLSCFVVSGLVRLEFGGACKGLVTSVFTAT